MIHLRTNGFYLALCFALTIVLSIKCQSKSSTLDTVNPQESNTSCLDDTIVKKQNKIIDKLSDSLLMKRLTGKFFPSKDSNFVLVKKHHSNRAIYLQKTVYSKYIEMFNAAKNDGISLKIISGTRNFYDQKSIWERKWTGKRILSDGTSAKNIKDPNERALKILLYSSMPSTSRHHWGTDIDINNLNNSYFESGRGLKEYNWLTKNASKYGFCQVYSDKKIENRTGYEMEKWHWSYIPIAGEYTKKYKKLISYDKINGFMGCKHAKEIGAIENYVDGINTECQ